MVTETERIAILLELKMTHLRKKASQTIRPRQRNSEMARRPPMPQAVAKITGAAYFAAATKGLTRVARLRA